MKTVFALALILGTNCSAIKERLGISKKTVAHPDGVTESPGSEKKNNSLGDKEAPTFVSISAVPDKLYLLDEKISFTVKFSDEVIVKNEPKISVDVGGNIVDAVYESGSGSDTLVFSFAVANGQNDDDGISATGNIVDADNIADDQGNVIAASFPPSFFVGVKVTTPWFVQLGATTRSKNGDAGGIDYCFGVAVDKQGNVYCAGETQGQIGEPGAGYTDAFVMKIDAKGKLQWVTQLGGTTKSPGAINSREDSCTSVAVDDAGNVFCGGFTKGSLGDTNVVEDIDDAFVMKLSPAGSLVWIMQLGASSITTGGDTSKRDRCLGVAVSKTGNIYCAGSTEGSLGEARGGSSDAFVMKLNAAGALQWITQLGAITTLPGMGNAVDSRLETCNSVAVDISENIYCAGYTQGDVAEANGGGSDPFLMQLDSSGAVKWGRQLGAVTKISGGDNLGDMTCDSIAVSADGVYCGGSTYGYGLGGINYPDNTRNGFVLKLDLLGVPKWSTVFASKIVDTAENARPAVESCGGIAVANNHVYCAGLTEGALGETYGGRGDAFLTSLSATDGKISWHHQFGRETVTAPGMSNLDYDLFNSVATDALGNIYVAGASASSMVEAGGGSVDPIVMKFDPNGRIANH
jgi:hypothetical protein